MLASDSVGSHYPSQPKRALPFAIAITLLLLLLLLLRLLLTTTKQPQNNHNTPPQHHSTTTYNELFFLSMPMPMPVCTYQGSPASQQFESCLVSNLDSTTCQEGDLASQRRCLVSLVEIELGAFWTQVRVEVVELVVLPLADVARSAVVESG